MARYPRLEIPSGTKYADLTVVREVEASGGNRRFLCRCKCGSETVKFMCNLRLGRSRTCGCEHARTAAAGRATVLAKRRARSMESEHGRICHTCDQWKPWDAFSIDKRRAIGRTSNCMECAWWRSVLATYGITKAEWEWMFADQGGVCALCEEADTVRLNVDHDHSCCGDKRACKKCIRGMLCRACNRMLGLAEGRPLVAARFADYLERRPLLASVPAPRTVPILEDVGDEPGRLVDLKAAG